MSQVRVRFAPSPTGYLHVGGVRALLFNWLYARVHQGTLVLRIEDTDVERSTRESEELMISTIKELNIDYDEGPDNPGEYGPYRQSERTQIYQEATDQLLSEGKAFYCFCTEETIAKKREQAIAEKRDPAYDGTCRDVTGEDALERIKAGEKGSIRLRCLDKDYIIQDMVRGDVEFKSGQVGDFVIMRSNGMPVYNYCCVIDDYKMKISHVIRGEDHLPNTVRQMMVYDQMGWEMPKFGHTAMVLGSDKQKLSKRNGDASTNDLLDKGYLHEAILNFLVLLGWWPPQDAELASGHPEVVSVAEMHKLFSADSLTKSPAVFDDAKLRWMNGFYIRNLELKDLAARAKPYFEKLYSLEGKSDEWLAGACDAVRNNTELLSDVAIAASVFFEEKVTVDEKAAEALKDEKAQPVVTSLEAALKECPEEITAEMLSAVQKKIQNDTGAKGKWLFMPVRALITGQPHGPDLGKVVALLGREEALRRIADVRAQVGV